MQNSALMFVIYVGGAVLVYGMISRGLFRATEGLRFSLLDLSEPLLENPSVPEREKRRISMCLDEAHSARAAWGIVWALISGLWKFGMSRRRDCSPQDPVQQVPANLRACYGTFLTRYIVSTVTNSPAAAFVFTVVIILSFCIVILPLVPLLFQARGPHEIDTHGATI